MGNHKVPKHMGFELEINACTALGYLLLGSFFMAWAICNTPLSFLPTELSFGILAICFVALLLGWTLFILCLAQNNPQ